MEIFGRSPVWWGKPVIPELGKRGRRMASLRPESVHNVLRPAYRLWLQIVIISEKRQMSTKILIRYFLDSRKQSI
jgi:hypothetical protein